ncbi:hypothetical protein [Petroclostridium sp. X23]|uniref:hypothetical protein n=1 Tax=Petroclostridium sp. X23 TaxID=3045146 RepID=UPI0024AE24ED|nr:hypothetical protein [Petroclostridium sp. X23]WHH59691.1 hypothetical protein QKW49_02710 [Petroclostridium sp. X23]
MRQLSLGEIARIMNKWLRFAKRMNIEPGLAVKVLAMHLESLGEKLPDSLVYYNGEQKENKTES